MWDDAKQARLDALRDKEELGALEADEERELSSLYAEVDAEEADRLHPAMSRTDQEISALRQRNARLDALVQKRRQLSARMRSQITEWIEEQDSLYAEAGALVGAGRPG